ncbi:hypothetical protein MPH_04756 [Macrophomina phaseolina MS6]|uniref:Uncharacterized protein n=1 Tax=Macrophomina phaseolina (strain MS6) TaxID=1126212 RepID=K2R6W7_MACPH|nr:hypothetical protein MPH_04756 [Macrophomina phaseolina MS6]
MLSPTSALLLTTLSTLTSAHVGHPMPPHPSSQAANLTMPRSVHPHVAALSRLRRRQGPLLPLRRLRHAQCQPHLLPPLRRPHPAQHGPHRNQPASPARHRQRSRQRVQHRAAAHFPRARARRFLHGRHRHPREREPDGRPERDDPGRVEWGSGWWTVSGR